ncbi:hypothetical protein HRD86_11310 [Enterococcus faecalis]|nr:hypothetical protein [Enterococcus faecalis]
MDTLFVNNRAIDSEELIDIIINANGIYENTLIKLLQCSRISLEARLKTLKKNKIISREKVNKHFYYVDKYDLKQMKDLDLQSMVVQYLVSIGLYTNKIQVIDSLDKNKQLYISVFTSGKYNYKNDEAIKKLANKRFNQLSSEEGRKCFSQFIINELTKFPIRVASFSDTLQKRYYTTSLETIDVLAIPTREFISAIQTNLADVTFRNLEKNTTLIRNDILIYLNDSNTLGYFAKEKNQYKLQTIHSVVDFFYYLTLHQNSKDAIYISNDKTEYDNADNLYFQSYLNKEKYNTVQLKRDKQKPQP